MKNRAVAFLVLVSILMLPIISALAESDNTPETAYLGICDILGVETKISKRDILVSSYGQGTAEDQLMVMDFGDSYIFALNRSDKPDEMATWSSAEPASEEDYKNLFQVLHTYGEGYGISETDRCIYLMFIAGKSLSGYACSSDTEPDNKVTFSSVDMLITKVAENEHPALSKWVAEELLFEGEAAATEAKATAVEEEPNNYSELAKGAKGDAVKNLQTKLKTFGYNIGTADGDYGNKTKTAVEQFQRDNGLSVTGVADSETQKFLFENEVNPCLVDYGKEYISQLAIDEISKSWEVPSSDCEVGDIYCLDKGNNTYHFSTFVYYTKGSGQFGLGRDINFKRESDKWTVTAGNEIKLYTKMDKLDGVLVFQKNTPVSEMDAASTPKPTTVPAKKPEVSQIDIAAYAVNKLKGELLNPASLQVHGIDIYKDDSRYYVIIDASAMNRAGGYNREDYYVSVNAKSMTGSLMNDQEVFKYKANPGQYSRVGSPDVNSVMALVS